jgi:tetratricopeptide (TPR) repeat protein
MVFEDVLGRQEERFEQYMRCLGALNLDYSSDRTAFRQMTRAKTVLELFSDHELAVAMYELAQERAGPSDGTLLHQLGLYELRRPNGSLSRSSELLTMALELRRYDPSIKHSFAELHLRLAETARTNLERAKHLNEATALCRELIGKTTTDAHAHVTLVKIGLKKLEEAIEDANSITIEQAVKDVESALRDGLQRFPNDAYLRVAESRLAEAIDDSDRAISALQKAFQTNPRSTFIAIRLSQAYRRRKDDNRAREVLEAALGANGGDRRLHHAYAKLLISTNATGERILYHLQRSFAVGDSNYDARVLYARQLYISGDPNAAFDITGVRLEVE